MTKKDQHFDLDGQECYEALRPKWRHFVDLLLIEPTPLKAYAAAGYRGDHSRAHKLLHRPEVWAAYNWKVQQRSERLELTADRVMQELAALSFSDVGDVMEWDGEGGVSYKPSKDLPKHVRAAIKSVEVQEVETEDENGNRVARRRLKFVMHSKESAPMKLLMAQMGMTTSRTEVNVLDQTKAIELLERGLDGPRAAECNEALKLISEGKATPIEVLAQIAIGIDTTEE